MYESRLFFLCRTPMHRAVAAWLLRPIAGDGPIGDGRCEWGWTHIDDACFKVTQGI